MDEQKFQIPEQFNGQFVGDPTNPYQQQYIDTCAIKSQQLILNEFGIPVTEDDCVKYSMEKGWYHNDGSGTTFEDIGKLLTDAGVPCTQSEGANVYDLANQLAQGHKVVVAVDSGELWDNGILDWLKDFFFGNTPDHAVIVAGVDMTDPDNPMVLVTDPGNGTPTKPYPLDQFMDAWADSECYMVSTDVATPDATQAMRDNGLLDGHLNSVAGVGYDTFHQFLNYSHQMDFSSQSSTLYDAFQQFPTSGTTFDDLLTQFSLPVFDSASVIDPLNTGLNSLNTDLAPLAMTGVDSLTTPGYVDPFTFDFNSLNTNSWLDEAHATEQTFDDTFNG